MTNKRLENVPPWDARTRGTRPSGPPLPPGTERCTCGKLRFLSEQTAKDVVLEARIARVLRHNHRRREDRHYRCRFGGWHTTSQPAAAVLARAS